VASRRGRRATWLDCRGKSHVDRAGRRGLPEVCELLGAVMPRGTQDNREAPGLLDVVALLNDRPAQRLVRGQVGTVVEQLDDRTTLVEFSDDQGRAYAVEACPRAELLVLHYVSDMA
jgi:hypothetical protein